MVSRSRTDEDFIYARNIVHISSDNTFINVCFLYEDRVEPVGIANISDIVDGNGNYTGNCTR